MKLPWRKARARNVAPPSKAYLSPALFPISVADGLLWARLGVDRGYRLRARAAAGSYGIVFLAHAEGAGDVAVKGIGVLHSRNVDAVHRALCDAVERVGRVGDPAVLVPFQCGRSETAVYYMEPWIAGGSVADELLLGKPVPLARVAAILRAVAPALDGAHERGLLHGGIRPGNLLLDPDGRVLLADFGIVTALERLPIAVNAEAARGQAYTAPEQWRRGHVDGRADQYALALVAFEMLTAQSRFDARGVEGVPTLDPLEITDHTPLRPDVPLYVNWALRTALSAKPANRFPTVSAFVDAMEGKRPGAVQGPPLVRFRIGDIKPRHVMFTLSGVMGIVATGALGDAATHGALRGKARDVIGRYVPDAPKWAISPPAEPGALHQGAPGNGAGVDGRLAGGGGSGTAGGRTGGGVAASYGASQSSRRTGGASFGPEITGGPTGGATSHGAKPATSGTEAGKRRLGGGLNIIPPPPTGTAATSREDRKSSDSGGLFASLYARARQSLSSALRDRARAAGDTATTAGATSASEGSGAVTVDAEGGPALITVDGIPMGTTPAALRLLPGDHTIAVHGTRSYEPSEVVVNVKRGGRAGASFRVK